MVHLEILRHEPMLTDRDFILYSFFLKDFTGYAICSSYNLIIALLIMALPVRIHVSNRVIGFLIFCALLSLIWFNAGSQAQLRQTYTSLYKQAKQSAAASALATDKRPDVDTQPHNVTTRPINLFDEEPHVDAKPYNVLIPSKNVSHERPDVDAQSHKVTTPPKDVFGEQPDVDAQSSNFTTPSTNISSPAPFPPLPPPDDEEYMAICMAGEHMEAYRRSQSSTKRIHSEKSVHRSSRILHSLLLPPWYSSFLHLR